MSLVTVGPLVVVVLVVDIKLTDELIGTDLCDLVFTLGVFIFFTLLFLGFLLLLFGLGVGGIFFGLLKSSFFLGSGGWAFLKSLVELIEIVWNLTEQSLLFLDPVAALFEHLIFDVVALNSHDLLREFFALHLVLLMVAALNHLGGFHCFPASIQRVISFLLRGLGASRHA